jgi:DNA polymerase III epsilon subunit-like protein
LSPRDVKAREAKRRYNSQKYLLIDTETTGLDARKNAIIEVGAQVLDEQLNPVEAPPFHALVRPHEGAIIDKRALNVNNHHWVEDPKSDGYAKALDPKVAWQALDTFLTEQYDVATWIVLVGWNVGFDEEFLKGLHVNVHDSEPTVGKPPWAFHYHKIDLLGVVRFFDARLGRNRRSYKLEHIAKEYFGVMSDFAMHTALGDSQMCIKVAHAAEKELLDRVRTSK